VTPFADLLVRRVASGEATCREASFVLAVLFNPLPDDYERAEYLTLLVARARAALATGLPGQLAHCRLGLLQALRLPMILVTRTVTWRVGAVLAGVGLA